jgi:hypothetical protein
MTSKAQQGVLLSTRTPGRYDKVCYPPKEAESELVRAA